MKLIGVRRLVIVYRLLRRNADRIDNERVTFIVANRLAIIGWLNVRRMRNVQINMTDLVIALIQERNLVGLLRDKHSIAAQ